MQLFYYRVKYVLNTCSLNCTFHPIVILVYIFEPTHVVMRMRHYVNVDTFGRIQYRTCFFITSTFFAFFFCENVQILKLERPSDTRKENQQHEPFHAFQKHFWFCNLQFLIDGCIVILIFKSNSEITIDNIDNKDSEVI